MKHQPYRFQRHLLTLLLIWTCSLCALSNTTVTVTQVEGKVTLTDDVDYVVTSKTPFISGGQIDIVNTEHAVVILSALKPSEGIKELQHIRVHLILVSFVQDLVSVAFIELDADLARSVLGIYHECLADALSPAADRILRACRE